MFYDKIKIYYDGINYDKYKTLNYIKGCTTNPSLLKKNNNSCSYKTIAKEMLKNDIPLSLEVFSDDHDKMIEEAREISKWGEKIYVKIPIVNTKGETTEKIIEKLNSEGIKLNITAVFTQKQIKLAYKSIKNKKIPNIISIFSGRIADTGIDPAINVKFAVELIKEKENIEILWASVREVLNIFQAIETGCHIITIPDSIFDKISCIGKDLNIFSIETVKMFYDDGKKSGIHF